MRVHTETQRRLNKMESVITNRPIPGQSLTTTPKNAQYEQPPLIVDPEEALQLHLKRLSKPRSMEDILEFIDTGVDVRTIVEGILRGAVLNGIHSIDVSLIIAPVIHEFVRGLPLAAGIDFEDGFEDQQDVCSFLRNKVEMLEHKLKEAHQINLNASVMKNEIGIIDEKTQKDLETLENTNIDIEKEKGQNDSPLVKHTTSLFKKEKPRRHSFYGILQGEHREEAIARHRRANSPFQKISNDDGLSAAVLPARADHPPATKLKPFSLSELNFVILDIYQSKIVADSIADADMARRVHLSEHVRSYYVKMHGTRSFASHHCSHLQRELPLYASTNFRCRLFALLIGTLEPRSYLNHVAATDFFLGVLLKIFDINEKELMIQNVMPLSLKEMMGDGLNYDGHRPCVLDAKKACSIIRELFSFEEVSEKNLFFLASFVNKIMRFSIMCVCCLLSHASNSIRMVPTLAFGFRYGLRVYLSCSCVTKQCLTISIVCFIGVWGGDGTLGINFKRGEWGPSGSFSV